MSPWTRHHLPLAWLLGLGTVLTLVVAQLASVAQAPLTPPSRVPAAVRAVAWQTAVAWSNPYPELAYSWVGTTVGAWERLTRSSGRGALGTRIWVVRLQGRFLVPSSFPLAPARLVEVAFPALAGPQSAWGSIGIEFLAGSRVPALSSLGQVRSAALPAPPLAERGVVPLVVGLALPTARSWLAEARLRSRVVRRPDRWLPPGTVLAEMPAAGTKAATAVTLVATPGYYF